MGIQFPSKTGYTNAFITDNWLKKKRKEEPSNHKTHQSLRFQTFDVFQNLSHD
jgi:hypothetical protein